MNHLNNNELVLALDGEMDEAELKQAVDHMAECDACRERWEKLQGLSARVVEYQQALYASDNKNYAAVRHFNPPAKSAQVGHPTFPRWSWGLVSAVVLVGVSVAFWSASHSSGAHPIAQQQGDKDGAQPPTPPQVAVDAHAPLGAIRNPGHLAESGANVKAVKSSKLHAVKKTPAADKPDTKLAQFTELPFSDASLPLDQATIVRVTLPAAALRQAGVAVNEDNANAMLKADVVLGMDGLPRGIRLVNMNQGGGSSGTN